MRKTKCKRDPLPGRVTLAAERPASSPSAAPMLRSQGCSWDLFSSRSTSQHGGCTWPQVAEHPGKVEARGRWAPGHGTAPSSSQHCSLSSTFLGVGFNQRGWSRLTLACRADCTHSVRSVMLCWQLESGHGGDIYTMEICNPLPISTFFF